MPGRAAALASDPACELGFLIAAVILLIQGVRTRELCLPLISGLRPARIRVPAPMFPTSCPGSLEKSD